MNKEDLHFHMICPKCYQQDHLMWFDLKKLVLDDSPRRRDDRDSMEGQYPCPYGCGAHMGLYSVGTGEEVNKKSDELHEKYWDKIPEDSCTKTM